MGSWFACGLSEKKRSALLRDSASADWLEAPGKNRAEIEKL